MKVTKLQNFSNASGLKLAGRTTAWNIHTCDSLANLAKKKGTNLHKAFSEMKKSGLSGGFTLVVGCIGRNGHSATEIGIFKGVNDDFNEDQVFINEQNSKFWK